MKVILNEQAIAEVERLCNELPIRCLQTAEAIIKVLQNNIEKEEPVKPKDEKPNPSN